jgi:hypothetical protein
MLLSLIRFMTRMAAMLAITLFSQVQHLRAADYDDDQYQSRQ